MEGYKLPFRIDLTGKTAVVTAAGGVLMSEFARALGACGARVALIGPHMAGLLPVAESIGDGAFPVEGDCTDRESLAEAHRLISRRFGAADILINGAGGNRPSATTDVEAMAAELPEGAKSFFDLSADAIGDVLDLNILSVFLTTQVFARDMVGRGGNIINISSMNSYRPLTKIPAYSAAKAGVSNLTQWLAVHFAPCGIRVNAIAPGFFVTKQNRALLYAEDGTPTARTAKILAATPQKRFGRPSDLIGTLLWLADDGASGFVTGTVVPVDGGFAAYSGV
jgi:NAD(P)-dependent dehydrogenase (short-subunit alcohol dehydrogenase family)